MKRLFLLLPLLPGSFIMVHAQTAEGQGGLAPVNPSQTASGPLPFTRPRAATPREASLSLSQSSMSYDTLGNRTQRVIAPAAPSREGERRGQGEEGQKKRDKELIPRKYIPSDYEMADIREFLPVAAISYQATVTPSGGRVYSVPIRTAARFTKNQKVAYPLIMNYDFRIKKFIY